MLATLTTFLLPDTLSISKASEPHHQGSDGQVDEAATTGMSTMQQSIHRAREGLQQIRSFLKGHARVIVMMFSYVFVALSKVVQLMLLQYTTKRYHWSWSKVRILEWCCRKVIMTLIMYRPRSF